MGAASKGIIQRGYQHNATVYKTPYAKNPFDSVTDDELKEYKRTVEKKRAGDCELKWILSLSITNLTKFHFSHRHRLLGIRSIQFPTDFRSSEEPTHVTAQSLWRHGDENRNDSRTSSKSTWSRVERWWVRTSIYLEYSFLVKQTLNDTKPNCSPLLN